MALLLTLVHCVLTGASGLHPRLGKDSCLLALDVDLLRCIFEASELRLHTCLNCEAPAPGCSLYGFMFDMQMAPSLKGETACVAVTALQVSTRTG
jgi:hypothetical protein